MTACTQQIESVAPAEYTASTVAETHIASSVQIATDAVDVTAFGAKGDGKTDDTEAIRRALKSSTGKQLVFKEGTYMLSQVVKLENSNVELVGQGVARLVSSERTIFALGDVLNVAFTNLSFESVSKDVSVYYYGLICSHKKSITGLSFRNCTFTAPECSTAGIKLVTDAIGSSVNKIKVSNCTFANLGNMGLEIQNHLNDNVARFSDVNISNNLFRNLGLNDNKAYHYGMAVSFSGNGSDVVVTSNTIVNPYDIGIELAGSIKNIQVLNNTFRDVVRFNKEANRPVAIIAMSSAVGTSYENVKINGNQNTGAADRAYVVLSNMVGATVENNTFNTEWHLQIRNVSGSKFKGNRIYSRGKCALNMESSSSTSQDNLFENSTFTCVGGASEEAVVKYSGLQTTRNIISNSQLTRRNSSTKFVNEISSASNNILKDCVLK